MFKNKKKQAVVLPKGAVYAKLKNEIRFVSKEEMMNLPTSVVQEEEQQELQIDKAVEQQNTETNASKPEEPLFSMRWFNYLIYFSLWKDVLLLLSDGLMSLIIFVNMVRLIILPDISYNAFQWLKGFVFVYGISRLFFAVCMVIVRFKLAKFEKEAPRLFVDLVTFEVVCYVVYNIFIGIILFEKISVLNICATIMANIIYCSLNRKYFDRRKKLFVN